MKVFGHYADHGAGFPIDGDGPSEQVRIGIEAVVPETMTQDHNSIFTEGLLVRKKCAAQCGSRFERIEKIGAYSCAGHAPGGILPRQVGVAHSPCGKILENLIVFATVEEGRRGSADFVSLLCINFPS